MWAISFSLIMFSGVFTSCSNTDDPETPPTTGEKSPYITRVLDFRPAVGQFVNQLPEYKEGDTQEDMNRKVLELSEITRWVWFHWEASADISL
mgnify:CR=1 FL=1